MLNDFKIYIPTLDEECLIPYTIDALLKVFSPEQIEVIDLGSKDSTVEQISSKVKIHSVTLPKDNSGEFFTRLKNEYSSRQGWVLWVDGDEIYPTTSLFRVRDWVEAGQLGKHTQIGLRVYWKILKEGYCSKEYLSAGPKLFNTNKLKFNRAWPNEVTVNRSNDPGVLHKSLFTGVWFWHGVLLRRSFAEERTSRYKKRLSKTAIYDKHLTWESIDKFPWENDYRGDVEFPWTVMNMSPHDGDYSKTWEGNRLWGVK